MFVSIAGLDVAVSVPISVTGVDVSSVLVAVSVEVFSEVVALFTLDVFDEVFEVLPTTFSAG